MTDEFHIPKDPPSLTAGLVFLHGEEEETSCAFEKTEKGGMILRIPRTLGASAVFLECYTESADRLVRRLEGEWHGLSYDADEFFVDLAPLKVGLYFCRMSVRSVFGRIFGYRAEDKIAFSRADDRRPDIQISVSEFAYPAPKEYLGGVIYHIFVDRFAKGGDVPVKAGALINRDWENGIPQFAPSPGAPLKNNMFFGGTLFGVREKLPYIASLGVNLIYLSPVFDSPSNHKYDTADYMTVDAMFGGEEALRFLIDEAKTYGIGIILDGVFNHTGADSLYFNKEGNYPGVGAYQSKVSPYFPWYEFQHFPDTYTCWWNIPILPRIHPDVPSCGEFFTGRDGVIRKYAAMGIAGMRLDVVDELSDAFVEKIKHALSETEKPSVLYGEVWEDASNKIAYGIRKKYYLGRELDGVMNYPVREGLIEYFTVGNTEKLRYALTDVANHAPKRIRDMQMNLLGTHDTERILTVLGGKPGGNRTNAELSVAKMTKEERTRGRERLICAYTVLATIPGIPSVYYGDEAGLEGYQDPFNRRPFPWGREDMTLLGRYRALGRLRRENDVYKDGAFRLLSLTRSELIFARYDKKRVFLTVVNRADIPKQLRFSGRARDLLAERQGMTFALPPMSASVYSVKYETGLMLET